MRKKREMNSPYLMGFPLPIYHHTNLYVFKFKVLHQVCVFLKKNHFCSMKENITQKKTFTNKRTNQTKKMLLLYFHLYCYENNITYNDKHNKKTMCDL